MVRKPKPHGAATRQSVLQLTAPAGHGLEPSPSHPSPGTRHACEDDPARGPRPPDLEVSHEGADEPHHPTPGLNPSRNLREL